MTFMRRSHEGDVEELRTQTTTADRTVTTKAAGGHALREAPASQDERLSWLVQQNDKKLLRCQEFSNIFVIRSK